MNRTKFILRSLFVCVAIVACCFGGMRFAKLSAIQADYRRLNSLVGDLLIEDPTKATIMRMPQDKAHPKLDRWRVYLPPNGRYSFYSFHVIEIQSNDHRSYSTVGYETLDVLNADNLTIGYGDIGSDEGIDRISFARSNRNHTSSLSQLSTPYEFSFDPKTDTVVWSDPLICNNYDLENPICLKAVYRELDENSEDKLILTSAIFICPQRGPDDHHKLIPFALPPPAKKETRK